MSERPDIVAAAVAYRAEQERQRQREHVNGEKRENHDEGFSPSGDDEPRREANGYRFLEISAAEYAGRTIPTRQFLDSAHLLPCRNVVLLGGDGGTGKSLLALQLAVAVASGTPWIGLNVVSGPVVYLSAEDDQNELHMRLVEICTAEGIDLSSLYTLRTLPMAGLDVVLAKEARDGGLRPTPAYKALDDRLAWHSPVLLIVDNLADTYAGNENSRPSAQQFIGLLRRLALKHDCTVLLLGHPSLSGRASGTGESGSTAWNASVRSRLYLHVPDGADALDDPDVRILESKKANYAQAGKRFNLRWRDCRFINVEPASPWDQVTNHDLKRVQEAFRAPHVWRASEKAEDWGGFKVAEVLEIDIGQGVPKAQRTALQERERHNVRVFLAEWLRNKQIFRVDAVDKWRRETAMYSDKPQER